MYVYILASWRRVLYVGVTNDLQRRLTEHRSGAFGGFTARYRVNRLVYFEQFDTIRQALGRERELKGWLRKRKEALIEQGNPRWIDLGSVLADGQGS